MPPSPPRAAPKPSRPISSESSPPISSGQGGRTRTQLDSTRCDSPGLGLLSASILGNPAPVSMAKISAQRRQSQAPSLFLSRKGKGGNGKGHLGAVWCLAALVGVASVALNLVAVSLLAPLYMGGEKGGTFVEKGAAFVEEDKEMVVPAGQVSATSGSRPASKDAVINLDHGDPTLFESFWKQQGERATIVIPGWHTMSYFSDATNLCWFLEPGFADEVRRLHKLVGNAAVDGRHIVVGTGSTQLFQAALFALSPSDAAQPMSVVSAIPYYSSYPAVTDYLRSGLFRWAGDANTFEGDSYIELVCSPNNPDGFMREAVLKSEAGKTVHDLAYYWPQYTAITEQADHEIMLFTVSKSTGHAGTRLGWALVKDREVAKKMTKFIELNTIGVSKDSQLRAARILKVVSDGYEVHRHEPAAKLFDYGRRSMAKRWDRLREAVAAAGIFSLPVFPSAACRFAGELATTYPAFAWLRCEKEGIEDCETFLKGYKILTRSGKHFGVDTKYVRVSMLDRDETFDLFIERLASIK